MMKKWTKLCAALLCAAVFLSAAGCSARTPVTSDGFKKQAQAMGFEIESGASSQAADAGAQETVQASNAKTSTELVFQSFSDGDSAQAEYASLKKQLAPNGGGNAVESATYNKYTVTVGELFYTLTRMDNTVVFGKATLPNQKEVEDFFKVIKY